MSDKKPIRTKPSLTFSHSAFDGEIGGGTGTQYHKFSSMHFANQQDAQQYKQKTGVTTDSGVQQGSTRLHLSRRGSIVGMSPNSDGSIDAFRFSSHPTTRALQQSDSTAALQEYQQAATELSTKATNTRNKPQSVNTVISDFGQPVFDSSQQKFTLGNPTHARGVSGSGLHKDVSKHQKTDLFGDSIQSHNDRGKKPTPSSSYHSEPAALKFHNDARSGSGLPSLRDSNGSIGIMESYSNQICAQCGPMLSQRVGSNSLVSGVPGNPFGGQKEGLIKPGDVTSSSGSQLGQATVFRTQPINQFGNTPQNLSEVQSIFDFHQASQSSSSSSNPFGNSGNPFSFSSSSGSNPFGSGQNIFSSGSSSNSNPFEASSTHNRRNRSSPSRRSARLAGRKRKRSEISGGDTLAQLAPPVKRQRTE